MEKWVKALQAQDPGDLGVKQVWNTVIKMVLVMLPVDNCTKLAVEQWTSWWSSLPGGLTVGENLVVCLIIVFILIGLGGVHRLWGGGWILKLWNKRKPQRDWTIFMGEVDP